MVVWDFIVGRYDTFVYWRLENESLVERRIKNFRSQLPKRDIN